MRLQVGPLRRLGGGIGTFLVRIEEFAAPSGSLPLSLVHSRATNCRASRPNGYRVPPLPSGGPSIRHQSAFAQGFG